MGEGYANEVTTDTTGAHSQWRARGEGEKTSQSVAAKEQGS